jgi:hypothetical protein
MKWKFRSKCAAGLIDVSTGSSMSGEIALALKGERYLTSSDIRLMQVRLRTCCDFVPFPPVMCDAYGFGTIRTPLIRHRIRS